MSCCSTSGVNLVEINSAEYSESQQSDLYGWAVIDEGLQSCGSHGKERFVYSALSSMAVWFIQRQFAPCYLELGKYSTTHLILKQWILMHKRKLVPYLAAGLTLTWKCRVKKKNEAVKEIRRFVWGYKKWAVFWGVLQPVAMLHEIQCVLLASQDWQWGAVGIRTVHWYCFLRDGNLCKSQLKPPVTSLVIRPFS